MGKWKKFQLSRPPSSSLPQMEAGLKAHNSQGA